MKQFKYLFISMIVLFTLITSMLTPSGAVLAQGDRSATVIPTLKAPLNTIVTKTPTYNWTKVIGATNYHYQILKGGTRIWDKYLAPTACGTSTCSIKPTLTLGYNVYTWRVQAMVGGGWKTWSAYKTFTVSPPSFYSGFNGSMPGWSPKGTGGAWVTYATYIATNGILGKYTNLYRNTGQYTDFDYSASMYSFGSEPGQLYLIFRAGQNVSTTYNHWYPAYYFGYYKNMYIVKKMDNAGVEQIIQPWTASSALSEYDFNVLRVVAYGNSFMLYINNSLVYAFADNSYSRGYVGFSIYHESGTYMSVDWASLTLLLKGADYQKALLPK